MSFEQIKWFVSNFLLLSWDVKCLKYNTILTSNQFAYKLFLENAYHFCKNNILLVLHIPKKWDNMKLSTLVHNKLKRINPNKEFSQVITNNLAIQDMICALNFDNLTYERYKIEKICWIYW